MYLQKNTYMCSCWQDLWFYDSGDQRETIICMKDFQKIGGDRIKNVHIGTKYLKSTVFPLICVFLKTSEDHSYNSNLF